MRVPSAESQFDIGLLGENTIAMHGMWIKNQLHAILGTNPVLCTTCPRVLRATSRFRIADPSNKASTTSGISSGI